MNGTQYINIIKHTLEHLPEDKKDSVGTINEVFKNCGVEFPSGSCEDIKKILDTNDYMSWEICDAENVKDNANNGVAVVGIKDGKIFLMAPETASELEKENENIRIMSEQNIELFSDTVFYSSTRTTTDIEPPKPYGSFQIFTSEGRVHVCNDGIGSSYGDDYHQSQTAFLNRFLNADIHNYIVIPASHPDRSKLLGCAGVTVRQDGSYVFGVAAETGSNEKDLVDEFSVSMVRELGFPTDGNEWVGNEENVITYIFYPTKKTEAYWKSVSDFNAEAERLGREYFY